MTRLGIHNISITKLRNCVSINLFCANRLYQIRVSRDFYPQMQWSAAHHLKKKRCKIQYTPNMHRTYPRYFSCFFRWLQDYFYDIFRGTSKVTLWLKLCYLYYIFTCISSFILFHYQKKAVIGCALSAVVHLEPLPNHISTAVQDLNRCW
jgi:hypothetical protein